MTDQVKKERKAGGHGADWWGKEISRSNKAWESYRKRARQVIERYRDEREENDARSNEKRFNILFSNTETLKPAIYSQPPIPDIRRRWQDKDPVGRLAATILQRATQFCTESYDFDSVLEACVVDYLLSGFATARIKYKPFIKRTPRKDGAGNPVLEEGKPAFDEELVYQEATTEYVGWDRFLMSRSRTYEKVWYVAFSDDLTREEVESTFGQEIAGRIAYTKKEHPDQEDKDGDLKARVWEVWCKRDRTRFFVAEGFDGWVSPPEPDPLRLQGFFPNPKPIWSIATNDTLRPVPEYTEYQDQARELDDLTERIDVLTSALRRRGVYDASIPELADLASSLSDNDFKGVNNWIALKEKGGLENAIAELPIEGIAKIIVTLDERRERVKQVIYEVTGIADIIRGASNPNETLGAQQLKGKWAGLRISSRQKKFAIFARDLVRMKAEVIAERFDPMTLSLISGIKLPTAAEKQQWMQAQEAEAQRAQMMAQQGQQAQPHQPNPEEAEFFANPTWEDVLHVLRSDKLRGFKIDIETDSTVQPDADAEKQARSELLQALGGFSQAVTPAVQAGLIEKKTAIELIQFAISAFKVGTKLEEGLDEAINAAQGPTPEQQAFAQQLQAKEQELAEREAKTKDEEHQTEIAKKDTERAQDKLSAERALFDLEKKFEDQILALQKQHMSEMQALVGSAEDFARDITSQGAPPQ